MIETVLYMAYGASPQKLEAVVRVLGRLCSTCKKKKKVCNCVRLVSGPPSVVLMLTDGLARLSEEDMQTVKELVGVRDIFERSDLPPEAGPTRPLPQVGMGAPIVTAPL